MLTLYPFLVDPLKLNRIHFPTIIYTKVIINLNNATLIDKAYQLQTNKKSRAQMIILQHALMPAKKV